LSGYSWIFGITCLFGIADIACFAFISDVPMKEPSQKVSLRSVVGRALRSGEYKRFVLFWMMWIFTGSLYAPYINMYTLGPLGFSLAQTTIFGQVVSSLAAIFMVQWWGRKLDAHGNQWVIRRVGTVACSAVLVWIFVSPAHGATAANIVPYFVYCLSTGLVFCGIDVTLQKMLMTSTPLENRSLFIALYSLTTAVLGAALGNLAGGWLLKQLGDISFTFLGIWFDRYKLMFFFGAALRLTVMLYMLPGLTKGEEEIAV
ncbi:MAG: hypothetical protein PHO66_05985, partial [Eubacteriales bacterium]|nr:hypothetical protein [Eubacteriales bacterium]